MTHTIDDPWTTRRLLAWMAETFTARGVEDARIQAEMLLMHVTGQQRLDLYTDADRPASPDERHTLRELVRRALAHEPVQYLVGHQRFYGLRIATDRRALIPRPETETLVEQLIVRLADAGPEVRLADVGTGSGCIAIALAAHRPGSTVLATDASDEALDLARENIRAHALDDRIATARGHLAEPLRDAAPLHAIASNPPYIPDNEWDAVPPNVRDHEPTLALRGGPDGLDLVRPLIADAPGLLLPGGWLAVEVASARAADTLDLATADPRYDHAEIIRDHFGRPRILLARRSPTP